MTTFRMGFSVFSSARARNLVKLGVLRHYDAPRWAHPPEHCAPHAINIKTRNCTVSRLPCTRRHASFSSLPASNGVRLCAPSTLFYPGTFPRSGVKNSRELRSLRPLPPLHATPRDCCDDMELLKTLLCIVFPLKTFVLLFERSTEKSRRKFQAANRKPIAAVGRWSRQHIKQGSQ